jgi:hypothetical protein
MPAGEGGQNPECWGQECLTEVIRLRGSREGNQHKVMFRKTLTVLQQKRGEPLSASVISGEELSLDSWERPGIRQSWEYEDPPPFFLCLYVSSSAPYSQSLVASAILVVDEADKKDEVSWELSGSHWPAWAGPWGFHPQLSLLGSPPHNTSSLCTPLSGGQPPSASLAPLFACLPL